MPIYEYKCDVCDKQFEVVQKMGDEPFSICPYCGSSAKRLISVVSGIIIKGDKSRGGDFSSNSSAIRCGRDTTCCGKETPCEKRPCDD